MINALLSRVRTYVLEPLTEEDIKKCLVAKIPVIEEKYPNVSLSEEALGLVANL